MDKKILMVLISLVSFTLIFGCTNTEGICGDGVCSFSEQSVESPYYCPQDCGSIDANTIILKIIPEENTTTNQLELIKEKEIIICNAIENTCKTETINKELIIPLNSHPQGFYKIKLKEELTDKNGIPLRIDDSILPLIDNTQYKEITLIQGIKYQISVKNNGNIIPPEEILVLDYRRIDSTNFYKYLEDYETEGTVPWTELFGENPYNSTTPINNQDQKQLYSTTTYNIKLQYGDIIKEFDYYLKQGENNIELNIE